jgi:hypothetical protein
MGSEEEEEEKLTTTTTMLMMTTMRRRTNLLIKYGDGLTMRRGLLAMNESIIRRQRRQECRG